MVNSVRILNQFCTQWNRNLQIAARANLDDRANVRLRVIGQLKSIPGPKHKKEWTQDSLIPRLIVSWGADRLDYGNSTSSESALDSVLRRSEAVYEPLWRQI